MAGCTIAPPPTTVPTSTVPSEIIATAPPEMVGSVTLRIDGLTYHQFGSLNISDDDQKMNIVLNDSYNITQHYHLLYVKAVNGFPKPLVVGVKASSLPSVGINAVGLPINNFADRMIQDSATGYAFGGFPRIYRTFDYQLPSPIDLNKDGVYLVRVDKNKDVQGSSVLLIGSYEIPA